MAIQTFNIGSSPNDRTGDTLRSTGAKLNANFGDLDQRTADATASAAAAVAAAAAAIPTTSRGQPNGVAPLGQDSRVPIAYLPNFVNYGECVVEGGSAANSIRLSRVGAGRLTIGGAVYTIPAAGIEVTFAQAAPGLLYYLYCTPSGSTISLQAQATGHTTHSDGTEIMIGNPNFVLVGMFRKNGNGQVVDTTAERGIASWFNRRRKTVSIAQSNASTASSTFVAANSRNVLAWKNDLIEISLVGIATNSAILGSSYTAIGNGATLLSPVDSIVQPSVANQYGSFAQRFDLLVTQDGVYQPSAQIRAANGTGTFNFNLMATVTI